MRTALLATEPSAKTSGFIVVAIHRNKEIKIWLDFDQDLPQALKKEILKNAMAVQPLEIHSSVFVFVMKVCLWGGLNLSERHRKLRNGSARYKKQAALLELMSSWRCFLNEPFTDTAQNGTFLRGRPRLSKPLFRLGLESDKMVGQNAGHENRLCPRLDGRTEFGPATRGA